MGRGGSSTVHLNNVRDNKCGSLVRRQTNSVMDPRVVLVLRINNETIPESILWQNRAASERSQPA